MKIQEIIDRIDKGRTDDVLTYLTGVNWSEKEEILMAFAYETDRLVAYTLATMLIAQNESSDSHYLASIILAQPLCHYPGAYQAAFFHAKKAVEFSKGDESYKEYLLFFHDIPDRLLPSEEAIAIAQEVLKWNPESIAAKNLLKRLRTE